MATTAHGTLTAGEITTLDVEAGRHGIVVVNPSQDGTLWLTINGDDPEPFGENTYACYGVREFPLSYADWGDTFTVKLTADAALAYSVEAY